MTSNDIIPNEFICPITLDIMIDPVICEDGYTYERNAILLLTKSISPLTRQPIDKTRLISNQTIKECIEIFNKRNAKQQKGFLKQRLYEKQRLLKERLVNEEILKRKLRQEKYKLFLKQRLYEKQKLKRELRRKQQLKRTQCKDKIKLRKQLRINEQSNEKKNNLFQRLVIRFKNLF